MTVREQLRAGGGPLIEVHDPATQDDNGVWDHLERARNEGADLIEVDVQSTADNRLVIRHHYTLPGGAWVSDLTVHQLTASLGRPADELAPVLDWARQSDACLVLDIKSGFRPDGNPHALVVEALARSDMTTRVLVSDWDHVALQRMKAQHPEIATRASIRGRLPDLFGVLRAAAADVVGLSWDLVRQQEVQQARTAGVFIALIEGWGNRYFSVARSLGADIVTWRSASEARLSLDAP